MDLSILIVGSSGLIGSNLVDELQKDGLDIIKADIASQHEPSKKQFNIDLSDELDVAAKLGEINSKWKITGIVNCAYPKGPNYGRGLQDVSNEDFCTTLSLHVGSYFNLMSQTTKILQSEELSFINFSSIYGSIAPRFEIYHGIEITMPIEYAAVKSAIIQITKYFAKYYQKSKMRFNCISPGGVYDGHNVKFKTSYEAYTGEYGMLDPVEIAPTVKFILSDGAKHINGQNVMLDDGFHL